jgi:hypothetical protein
MLMRKAGGTGNRTQAAAQMRVLLPPVLSVCLSKARGLQISLLRSAGVGLLERQEIWSGPSHSTPSWGSVGQAEMMDGL